MLWYSILLRVNLMHVGSKVTITIPEDLLKTKTELSK